MKQGCWPDGNLMPGTVSTTDPGWTHYQAQRANRSFALCAIKVGRLFWVLVAVLLFAVHRPWRIWIGQLKSAMAAEPVLGRVVSCAAAAYH